MGGWGCPHEVKSQCTRVPGKTCDPGMKGCVLFGRFTFSDDSKNRSRRQERDSDAAPERPVPRKR